ncbi:MAG TPA: PxKF domain-containing protein [Pyrinomonadaceae bacterium]|jgi:hypothetical protein
MKNSNSKPHEKTKSGIIKGAKFRFTALFVLIALASVAAFSSTAAAGSLSAFIFGGQSAEASGSTGASFFKPAAFFGTKPAPAPVVDDSQPNDDIATVTTDRTDYKPGETVVITGSAFTVYEPVTLKIEREGVEAATFQANADENGNFINRQFVIGANDVGASFVVKATGATSGKTAQSNFTDGTITYTPATQTFTGGSAVTSGATAATVTFDQTVILPSACGVSFDTGVRSVPDAVPFGGKLTTAFPSGFVVSAPPLNFGAGGGAGNLSKSWTVSIQIPANTAPGFYSTRVRVANPQCHNAGSGTLVIIEVKAPTPTDTTAPTTTVTSGTYVNNAWTKNNVTVNLSSADNPGGVGMQILTYTVTKPNNVSTTANVTAAPFTASIPVTDQGMTTIQYFARDLLNNTEATQTFYVNIDKTAPALALPNNVTVQADDATGKIVSFNATATDRAPASQAATCTPASGSKFAIGTTTVNCSATDDVGNISTGSFTVNVTPAGQVITFDALVDKVYGDADFTAGATSNSGLPVSFAASGNCTVTGNLVHITGAGSCTITASQAGNSSYLAAENVARSFDIAKADATCVINRYTGTYDAAAHGAAGSCTGADAGGAATGGTLDLGASFTDYPGGTANWTFTGGSNYKNKTGSVAIVINKADADVVVNGYDGTYDGAAHGATGTATGVGGANLSAALNLGASFTNVPGGTANWTFTGGTNYVDESGSVEIKIGKADAVIEVAPYNVTYNGAAHTATGTAKGVSAEALSGLDLSGTTHTDAGSYNDTWTFTDVTGNYKNATGAVNDVIAKAPVTATAGGGSSVYDGTTKSPSACVINGVYKGDLACANDPSTVGPGANTYTVAPIVSGTGLSNFSITNVSGTFTINKAPSQTAVTFEAGPYVYRGGAFTATAKVTGAGGLNEPLTVVYSGNCTNVTASNGCTAAAAYAGDVNHNGSGDTRSITITPKQASWTTNNNGKIFGSSDPTPLTTGSGSGFLPADNVTATYARVAGEAVGPYPITATLGPQNVLANYSITNAGATFTISAWTLNGFYQPIGVPNTYNSLLQPANLVWNTIKGGQTVPLKFNVLAGTVEQTATGAIKAFTVQELNCTTVLTATEDQVDFTTTGGTSLRYSGTPGVDGQFIQNWQTPATANKCYRVVMTTLDNSQLVSYFKTKK